MRKSDSSFWRDLKHRFVLTAEEKRVVTFVIAAFVLGLGTKFYRDSRPKPPVVIEKKHAVPGPARGSASRKLE